MDKKLIWPADQTILRAASGAVLATEIARVKADLGAPASWRLDPTLTAFYNPTGMDQAAIDAYESTQRTAMFTATSNQKDMLATCALVVRAKGLAAWNAMTTPQKVTATLAERDAWINIRDFIETNVP